MASLSLPRYADEFLLRPEIIFLNHGSFGACPRPVFESYQEWQRRLEAQPVEFLGRRISTLLAEARTRLAAYLGTAAGNLVYVPNATYGVNIVARSLDLQPGDEVLASDHEYGAADRAWRFVCNKRGVRYINQPIALPLESAEQFVEQLWAGVTPRTKVIFLSHITSPTALIFPLEAVCRRARAEGIMTVIDGAHAPGQIDLALDALGADFYTGNCHKWMCAPKGTGFLHARAQHHATLQAPVVSWGYVAEAQGDDTSGGHSGFDAYTGHTPLERRLQWQGTRDISGFLAVPAAIEFQRAHDWTSRRARCHDAALTLMHRVLSRNGLTAIAPDAAFAQMVPIPVSRRDAQRLRQCLFEQYGIEVPVTQHRGLTFVRASVQAYNDRADLDALDAALAAERA